VVDESVVDASGRNAHTETAVPSRAVVDRQ
jgi:hypothetical protein